MPKITELTELDEAPAAGDKLPLVDVDDVSQSADGTTKFITFANLASELGGGGVIDHGGLAGLTDDDHPQYHNDTRGDARYSQLGHGHDHGSLAGLDDDDHPIYLKADGTRALAGPMDMDGQALTNVNIASVSDAIGLNLGGTGASTAAAARANLDALPIDAGIVAVSSSRDLVASDNGKILEATGTITITGPDGLDTGFQVAIVNVGSGVITIAAATTLQSKRAAVTIDTQYAAATLYHRGSNVWLLLGDIA